VTPPPPPTYAYVERVAWDSPARAAAMRTALTALLRARLVTWSGELPADRTGDRWERAACEATARDYVVIATGGRYTWDGGDVIGDVVTLRLTLYDCGRHRNVAVGFFDAGSSDATAAAAWTDATGGALDRFARRLRGESSAP
jgi:hypothetical protein